MSLRPAFPAALLAMAVPALSAPLAAQPAPQPAPGQAAKPQFAQGSMNVFRRFPAEDRARMVDFYGKALGLQPLQPIQLTPTMQMILFRVGTTGQIKLSTGLTSGRRYQVGGLTDATGIRLYTLAFPDEAAVVARFTSAGYPAPVFTSVGGGLRAAMVEDPGGFPLRLMIVPGVPPATIRGVDVGIAVSDLARSRAFYRDFVGLEELPPVKDALVGRTTYRFRHGETTLSLWAVGKGRPADTGSAGIQYVISNIDAVDAAAKARHVTVETPLGGVPGFNVRTVWLNDPDGVTNYFYQLGGGAAR